MVGKTQRDAKILTKMDFPAGTSKSECEELIRTYTFSQQKSSLDSNAEFHIEVTCGPNSGSITARSGGTIFDVNIDITIKVLFGVF